MTLNQVFEFLEARGIHVQEYYQVDFQGDYFTLVVYSRYAPWGTQVNIADREDYPMEDIKLLVERIHADLDSMSPSMED